MRALLDRQAAKLAAGPQPRRFDEARSRAIKDGLWRRNVRLAEADSATTPLQHERLKQRLTIHQLAKTARMSPRTIVRAEHHPERPRPGTWGRLAKVLGVPVESIRP